MQATSSLPAGGSGWWPKAIVRPSKVERHAWSTIHLPLLQSPHKYVRVPQLYITHFRYMDFKRCVWRALFVCMLCGKQSCVAH